MSKPSQQNVPSKTWMLFESGACASVDLSLYSPAMEKSRPIDAYVVTECEGDFTVAARRAAEAIYYATQERGEKASPVVVGYDLQGLPAGRAAIGGSGGLAFAVALAKRLIRKDPGPVAATGEIISGNDGGPVGPVRGLEQKMETAGRILGNDGWILYPRSNEKDMPETVRRAVEEKGLQLHAVSSISEALDLLFPLERGPTIENKKKLSKGRFPWKLPIIFLFCMGVLSALWFIHGWPPLDAVRVVKDQKIREDNVATQFSVPSPGNKEMDLQLELTGEGRGLDSDLASLVSMELRSSSTDGPGKRLLYGRLSGRVDIIEITETPSNTNDLPASRMVVEVKELKYRDDGRMRSFLPFKATVSGEGSARDLLSAASLAVSENILAKLTEEASEGKSGPREQPKRERGFD